LYGKEGDQMDQQSNSLHENTCTLKTCDVQARRLILRTNLFLVTIFIAFVFIVLISVILNWSGSTNCQARTLTVDGNGNANFLTIQNAIDHSDTGDVITVRSGIYLENIIIHTEVELWGEDYRNTTIDGQNQGDVIRVTADDVDIRGFTILGSELHAGVYVYESRNTTIRNNSILGCKVGILVRGSATNCLVQGNRIFGNFQYGIDALENNGEVVHAEQNWWGENSGPFHPDTNSDGAGNPVSSFVNYRPWEELMEIHDVNLRKIETGSILVNPKEHKENEFSFILKNTGNVDDRYRLLLQTDTGSGPYSGWTMKFRDRNGDLQSELTIPDDVNISSGYVEGYLPRNEAVPIALVVTVDEDTWDGPYSDIVIAVYSLTCPGVMDFLSFNLTVARPNIRVTDDPDDFRIIPSDVHIEEDDDVEISVRVYNDGITDTGDFYVWFYNGKRALQWDVSGNYFAREKVFNIPPHFYVDVFTVWYEIPDGENDIYVYADKPITSGFHITVVNGEVSGYSHVLESRENDNTATISDIYQEMIDLRPDLTIIDVDFDDREVDSTTTVTVTIANVGKAVAKQDSAIVSLKIGGVSLKGKMSKRIHPYLTEEIDIGDDIDMEFIWKIPDDPKNYTMKATVDHPDDSNSRNDRLTTYVVSQQPPCCFPQDTTLEHLGDFCYAIFLIFLGYFLCCLSRRQRGMISVVNEEEGGGCENTKAGQKNGPAKLVPNGKGVKPKKRKKRKRKGSGKSPPKSKRPPPRKNGPLPPPSYYQSGTSPGGDVITETTITTKDTDSTDLE